MGGSRAEKVTGFVLPGRAEERRIIGSFKAGEVAGLESLYNRYSRALVGFCRGRLSDPTEADDACQEALLKAHRGRDGFREEASIWPWLATIAAHVCVEFNRRRARTPSLNMDPEEGGIDEEVERRQRCEIVRRALRNLPDHYRSLLYLRHFEQRSYDDIVESLGLTEPTVRSTLMRARIALRAEVKRVARSRGQWPLPVFVPAPMKALARAWRRLADTARNLGGRFPEILEGAGGLSGGAANVLAAAVLAASIVVAPVDHPDGLEIPTPAPPVGARSASREIAKAPPAPKSEVKAGAGDAGAPAAAAQVSTGGWSQEGGGRTYEGPSARIASKVGERDEGEREAETGSTFVNCPSPGDRSTVMAVVCPAFETLPEN